ncbi:hypothetical protein EPUS_07517 [Endocarpon pusillum Z07020]|uniref:Uncharacterized protein n=1 Tax=Endocarpon pusillum (strain Z07020 / HMAS-L-300199) TaxID=1263415 RepID=U1GMT9_ENDPU|nr:uncharacterized protein EPUS_07517 [Endocarpon pusillum Z07020]ERF73583.1 hypothetical protein EPUS_07517 [Endocarpon pusillum Z07020]
MSLRGLAGTPPMPAIVQAFNDLPDQPRLLSGLAPNRWHISIRHVAIPPEGYLVFIHQPDSHYVHVEGPLPAKDSSDEHPLQIDGLEATLIIARMLLNGFVKPQTGAPPLGRPSSWFTNDEAFGERVTGLLRWFGVQQESLLRMSKGWSKENEDADEDWNRLLRVLISRTI